MIELYRGVSDAATVRIGMRFPAHTAMKLVAEYVFDAVKFEQLAAAEEDPDLKAALLRQADAYRKLAERRAKEMGIPPPARPDHTL